jgi:RimJ/RimL family protein N-acetyltransferase
MTVALREVDENHDWQVFAGWLDQPHVLASWGQPADIIAELQQHPRGDMRVITLNNAPIGLACWQVPTAKELMDAGLSDLPKSLVDIDIMLGEVSFLGLGHGTRALGLLAKYLKQQGVGWIGLAAKKSNQAANRSFGKVGCIPFRDFTEDDKLYTYFVLDLQKV